MYEQEILSLRRAPERAGVFINNHFLPAAEPWLSVVNPATENHVTQVSSATQQNVNDAVAAAKLAFNDGEGLWPSLSGAQRAEYLLNIAKLIRDRLDDISKLESLDNGKPFQEAKFDIGDVAGCFEYFAEQAKKLDSRQEEEVALNGQPKFKAWMRYEPVGVVAAVIPWNYPLLMAAWKLAPAFAAGCTVVLKTSENTPLTALELAVITKEAGLPDGVFNVLSGGPEAGAWLVDHTHVDKVGFTGSVPTGAKIMGAAAKRICNVCLELGGKSPLIIFDDTNLDQAVEWALFGCFFTNGQICSATSRVLVQEKLADAFLKKLVEHASKIPVVHPLEPSTMNDTGLIGPIVSERQYQRVLGYIEGAVKEGAKVLCGGKRSAKFEKGYFIEPTVLSVSTDSTVWKEEVFGPVMSVITFSTEQEAIRIANDTEYGLAAGVMSSDKDLCRRVARKLRVGIMWINCSQPTFVELPWGGMKKSGVGRELGTHGIDNYLEPKQVCSYESTDPWEWYLK